MTTLFEQWRIAAAALRANWFRAVLTALGVVIGVASLIAVTAVSRGAEKDVADSIRRARRERRHRRRRVRDRGLAPVGVRAHAHPADVEAIADLPMVAAVAPHQDMESLTISAGRNRTVVRMLVGITPTYDEIYNQQAAAGRLITETDASFGRSVMVLGTIPQEQLFPGENAIGKTRAGGQPGVRGGGHPGPQGQLRRREPRQPRLRPPPQRHPRAARRHERREHRREDSQRGRDRARHGRDRAPCCAASTSCRSPHRTTSRPRIRRPS